MMIDEIGRGVASLEEQQQAGGSHFHTPVASRTNSNSSEPSPGSFDEDDRANQLPQHDVTPTDQASRRPWGAPIYPSPGVRWMGASGIAKGDMVDGVRPNYVSGQGDTSGVLLVTDITHERLKELLAAEQRAKDLSWENLRLRREVECARMALKEQDDDLVAVMTEWREKMSAYENQERVLELARAQVARLQEWSDKSRREADAKQRELRDKQAEGERAGVMLRGNVESLRYEIEALGASLKGEQERTDRLLEGCVESLRAAQSEIDELKAALEAKQKQREEDKESYKKLALEVSVAQESVHFLCTTFWGFRVWGFWSPLPKMGSKEGFFSSPYFVHSLLPEIEWNGLCHCELFSLPPTFLGNGYCLPRLARFLTREPEHACAFSWM